MVGIEQAKEELAGHHVGTGSQQPGMRVLSGDRCLCWATRREEVPRSRPAFPPHSFSHVQVQR